MLDDKKGRWAEELPFLQWEDKTTSKIATTKTPFSLVFGTEVLIPTEVVILMSRYQSQDQKNMDRILAHYPDIIDKLRDLVRIHIVAHQQRITKSYKRNIKFRRLQVVHLVLRKTFQNTKDPNTCGLVHKREGPYLIDSKEGKIAY